MAPMAQPGRPTTTPHRWPCLRTPTTTTALTTTASLPPDYTFGYRYGYDDYEPPTRPRRCLGLPTGLLRRLYAGEVHPHSYYPETYAPPEALYPPYPPYDLGYAARMLHPT